MVNFQDLKMQEWFACYESNYNNKIVCKGGFTTALGADRFLQINNLHNANSTLLSVFQILPDFAKEIQIRRSYTKIFRSDIIIVK